MIPKPLKLSIIALIIVVLISVIIGRLVAKKPAQPEPTRVPSPTPVSSFQATSNLTDLKSAPNFVKEETYEDGLKTYNYQSQTPYIYDRVVEKDGKTQYNSNDLLQTDSTYPRLTTYFETYGEYEIRGLDRLTGLDIFVYPEVGIAVVGSEQANEAVKLIGFTPQSKAEFEKNLQPIMFQQKHQ